MIHLLFNPAVPVTIQPKPWWAYLKLGYARHPMAASQHLVKYLTHKEDPQMRSGWLTVLKQFVTKLHRFLLSTDSIQNIKKLF